MCGAHEAYMMKNREHYPEFSQGEMQILAGQLGCKILSPAQGVPSILQIIIAQNILYLCESISFNCHNPSQQI